MRKFEYSSSDFKKAEAPKYKLAIQFGKLEYGYTIYSIALKKFVFVKFNPFPNEEESLTEKLNYVFGKEPLIKLNYHSTAFLYLSTKATLIPENLFTEESKTTFFAYNHFLSETEIVLSNKIEHSDIVNVFSFPEKAKAILASNLTNYKIYHQYTSFVESALLSSANNQKTKEIYLNIDNDFFNICATQSNNLLFNNSFEYQTIDDFIYYVHLTLKNLNITDNSTPIILSGNISTKVGTYKILKRFFKNVKFKDNFPKAAFSKELKLDKHYFDNLIYITV